MSLEIGAQVYYLDLLGKPQIRYGTIIDKTKSEISSQLFLYKIEIAAEPMSIDYADLMPSTHYVWENKEAAIKGAVEVIQDDLAIKIKNLKKFAKEDISRIKSFTEEK